MTENDGIDADEQPQIKQTPQQVGEWQQCNNLHTDLWNCKGGTMAKN